MKIVYNNLGKFESVNRFSLDDEDEFISLIKFENYYSVNKFINPEKPGTPLLSTYYTSSEEYFKSDYFDPCSINLVSKETYINYLDAFMLSSNTTFRNTCLPSSITEYYYHEPDSNTYTFERNFTQFCSEGLKEYNYFQTLNGTIKSIEESAQLPYLQLLEDQISAYIYGVYVPVSTNPNASITDKVSFGRSSLTSFNQFISTQSGFPIKSVPLKVTMNTNNIWKLNGYSLTALSGTTCLESSFDFSNKYYSAASQYFLKCNDPENDEYYFQAVNGGYYNLANSFSTSYGLNWKIELKDGKWTLIPLSNQGNFTTYSVYSGTGNPLSGSFPMTSENGNTITLSYFSQELIPEFFERERNPKTKLLMKYTMENEYVALNSDYYSIVF